MGLGDIVGCRAAGLWTKTQDSESWEKGGNAAGPWVAGPLGLAARELRSRPVAGGPPAEVTQQLLLRLECAVLALRKSAPQRRSPPPRGSSVLVPAVVPAGVAEGRGPPGPGLTGASLPTPSTPCTLLPLSKDELEPVGCWGWGRGDKEQGVEDLAAPVAQPRYFFRQGVWTALSAGFPQLPQSVMKSSCALSLASGTDAWQQACSFPLQSPPVSRAGMVNCPRCQQRLGRDSVLLIASPRLLRTPGLSSGGLGFADTKEGKGV